ncbi:HIT domain containing protein, putative [Babesia bigemina]|uniref:HIT domain containing protein, putative n=1 Tax=Babesia bigemina TaxID=5866 RepID=A0A061DE30_BABBI|nr:HIT domain containing protein, putative [Babesia bigemina]CDR97919.1 HIT domain containing protein, putative [Babesia bigemina]|eukprot:XP_012770105.1 HIT domain containing protein, putative [Babesia bigemina]
MVTSIYKVRRRLCSYANGNDYSLSTFAAFQFAMVLSDCILVSCCHPPGALDCLGQSLQFRSMCHHQLLTRGFATTFLSVRCMKTDLCAFRKGLIDTAITLRAHLGRHTLPATKQGVRFSGFASHHQHPDKMGNYFDDAPYEDSDVTIFDRIVNGSIPSQKVYEDDKVCWCHLRFICVQILAFRDINPVAPVHILVVPKVRGCLSRLSRATAEDTEILGHMMVKVAEIVRDNDVGDFRLVVNNGPQAGQQVYHLHMHIIGGRELSWPPG